MEAVREIAAPGAGTRKLLGRDRPVATRRCAVSCARGCGSRRGEALPSQPAPGYPGGVCQEKQQAHGRGWVERNRAAHRRESPQRWRTRGRHRPGQRVACGCRVRARRGAGVERRRNQREGTSIGRRSPRQGDRCGNREAIRPISRSVCAPTISAARGGCLSCRKLRASWLRNAITNHQRAALGSTQVEVRPFNTSDNCARLLYRSPALARRRTSFAFAPPRILLLGSGKRVRRSSNRGSGRRSPCPASCRNSWWWTSTRRPA